MKKKVIALFLAMLMITVSIPGNVTASVYMTPKDIIEVDKDESKKVLNDPIKNTVTTIPDEMRGTAQGMVKQVLGHLGEKLSTLNKEFNNKINIYKKQ